MSIELEDFHEDIIGKASRGLGFGKAKLAAVAGISHDRLENVLCGGVEEEVILKVAPALGLDAQKLLVSARKEWRPAEVDLDGLFQANTPYHDMRVNAFLIWDEDSRKAVVFDTGTDVTLLLEKVRDHELSVKGIFVTHTHGDHIAELAQLRTETGNPPTYVNRLEPLDGAELIDEGFSNSIGSISIRSILTSGHSVGGTTFLVNGLSSPVAVVGDALFAGSMGGGMVSYADALRNNREKLMPLPEETVVCPGHGPITTIGEEKQANPFFPEF